MVTGSAVKASVVDITSKQSQLPKHAVVDANVLYFVFYPNFNQLFRVGGTQPRQLPNYQGWWKRALQNGTKFFASSYVFGEFLNTVEHAELEADWLADPTTPKGASFNSRECKQARYDNIPRLPTIRSNALAVLASARKKVDLMPKFGTSESEIAQFASEWSNSTGDFGEAVLVANCKMIPSYCHVVSDDADLVTFDGITLYTANQKAITAAKDAGKLIV